MGKHSFDEKETKRKRNEQDDYEALKRFYEPHKTNDKPHSGASLVLLWF